MARLTMIVAAALAPLGASIDIESMDWTQVTAAAPWSARSDMCVGVLGEWLVIAGGHASSDYTNDVWRTRDGVDWELVLAEAPWAARSYHSCMVLPESQQLLLLGGHAADDWFSDVWVSGPDGDVSNWELVAADSAFGGRAAASLMRQPESGRLFLLGGSDGLLFPGSNASLFDDVWASDDDGASWALVIEHAGWDAREGETGGVGVVVGGGGEEEAITLLGGEAGYTPGKFFADVWTSKDGAAWTERRTKAEWAGFGAGSLWNLKGRSGHIVAKQEAEAAGGNATLWLAGGYLGRHDVWCLGGVRGAADLEREWQRVGDAPWAGRYDHILVPFAGKLVMLGGENSAFGTGGPYYNDVWTATMPPCPAP